MCLFIQMFFKHQVAAESNPASTRSMLRLKLEVTKGDDGNQRETLFGKQREPQKRKDFMRCIADSCQVGAND